MPDLALVAPSKPDGTNAVSWEPIEGRCNARRVRGQGLCQRHPVAGKTRCQKHGGRSLSGVASPSFKTGRWSTALPQRLLARYEQAQSDGELLALRDEIQLTDARLGDLLSRADSGESGQLWLTLQQRWREFQRYRASGDVRRMQASVELLGEQVQRGVSDHEIWTEIGSLMDRRQRLVEAERRRLETMAQSLTVEEAMGLLRTVLDVIRRNVTDRAVLGRIASELGSLVTLDAAPLAFRTSRRNRRR